METSTRLDVTVDRPQPALLDAAAAFVRPVVSRIAAVLPPPIVFFRLVLFLACVWALWPTQADTDLWGHLRFGGNIVAQRTIPQVDPYSFTSDRPWVNHEWLAEVLMFGAYGPAGAVGLMALKLAIDLGLLLIVLAELRRSLPAPLVRDRFTALLIVGIKSRAAVYVRPQLFSLLLFGVLLALLARADRGRWRALLLVPPLMALWTNLHGGWLVGLGTLGIWLVFRLFARNLRTRDRAVLLLLGGGSLLATLANPYGVGMWRFLHETVGMGRPDISEWWPIYLMPPGQIVTAWLPVLVAAIFLIVRLGRRNQPAYVAIVALLALGSFRVNRLDAFFAIAVVMLLAPMFRPRDTSRAPAALPASPVPVAKLALAVLLVAAVFSVPIWFAARDKAYRIGLEGNFLPEPEAAAFVMANHLSGRMITWFDWGEYAIWHFSPAIKVSLDGRRETVYSINALRANYNFCNAKPGAVEWASRTHTDYVWLPNGVGVAPVLEREGWNPVFRGRISSIFARPGDARRYLSVGRSGGSGSFPGP